MIPLPADTLTRDMWDAEPPSRDYVDIPAASRPGVEAHHSVGTYRAETPEGFARAVQRDHLGRDWTDAFYNAAVWHDGRIIELRPWHARSGEVEHLTVVFPGNYDLVSPTAAQRDTWWRLVRHVRANNVGRDLTWHRAREPSNRCPGDNVIAMIGSGPGEPQEEDMIREGQEGPGIRPVRHLLNRLIYETGGGLDGGGAPHDRGGAHLVDGDAADGPLFRFWFEAARPGGRIEQVLGYPPYLGAELDTITPAGVALTAAAVEREMAGSLPGASDVVRYGDAVVLERN